MKNAGLSYRCCQGNFDKWFTRHFTRACAQRASAAVRSFWKCIWERTISRWCSFSSIHSIEVVKSFIQKKSCLHSCVSNRLIGSSCRLHCSVRIYVQQNVSDCRPNVSFIIASWSSASSRSLIKSYWLTHGGSNSKLVMLNGIWLLDYQEKSFTLMYTIHAGGDG